jgi:hypothetical protein
MSRAFCIAIGAAAIDGLPAADRPERALRAARAVEGGSA